MTMEQLYGIDPEPDPEETRKHRARAQEDADDWWLAQEQYERHLGRMGGEDR